MASTSSSAASVGSDVPAGGTTCASLTSVPVAVVDSVPVAVKVTLPPVDTVTSALMLPVPLEVPHWARPVATQVQVTPSQEQRERVADGRGGGGARPGVGDDDLVGHRRAGDDPVDAVAVRDVQIGHGRGERRRGRRRVVARREVLRRRRRRRGAHDRVGRRVAARNVRRSRSPHAGQPARIRLLRIPRPPRPRPGCTAASCSHRSPRRGSAQAASGWRAPRRSPWTGPRSSA